MKILLRRGREEDRGEALYQSRSALVAGLLTLLALGRNSSDNIIVIVIDLKRIYKARLAFFGFSSFQCSFESSYDTTDPAFYPTANPKGGNKER